MFPNPNYHSPKWPIAQHMKLIVEGGLYQLLYAACTYASEFDPSVRINEYIIANDILPPNIRSDNNQPNIWRDYQQTLSELGFIYSTRITGGAIVPTAVGLYLLDNEERISEILTYQTLLYQYPNGGKREYHEEQTKNRVLIRPAVLIWRTLSLLRDAGTLMALNTSELKDYLMRCANHTDTTLCVNALINYRNTGIGLAKNDLGNANRNASDWIVLLTNTLLFRQMTVGIRKYIAFSDYAIENYAELDEIIRPLENEATFWQPSHFDNETIKGWYSFFGSQRFEASLPAGREEIANLEFESNGEEPEVVWGGIGTVQLTEFNPERLNFNNEHRAIAVDTIESSYDSAMVVNRHRLHDSMVILIASHCRQKGADVYEDPKSIDLMVVYNDVEYLIEVKTVGSRNYIKRLRYAVGQLFHYDFMLSENTLPRRKVVGIAGLLPSAPSLKTFFTEYLDMDLLSLIPSNRGQILCCNSANEQSVELFTS